MAPRTAIKNKRLLKIDKNYVPLPTNEGDEIYANGIFTFNISKMLEFIADGKLSAEMQPINVIQWFKTHVKGVVNEEYLPTVDVTKPVLQAEIRPTRFEIIDGHHRIEKAYRDSVESIESYVLKGEQLIPFLTTTQAYEAFIGYWNDKCREDNY